MKRLRSHLFSALALAALAWGCDSDPGWRRQSFALSVPDDPPAAQSRTNLVALARVTVSPLFQGRSFTYRTAENAYEQDPYASFLVPPERDLAEPIRAWMREGGALGNVLEPGSALTPSVVAEAFVQELDGDFRNPAQPVGSMVVRFLIYEVKPDGPGRVLLDKVCARQTPLARRTPSDLAAAWDADLRDIMQEINSEYAKTHPIDR